MNSKFVEYCNVINDWLNKCRYYTIANFTTYHIYKKACRCVRIIAVKDIADTHA